MDDQSTVLLIEDNRDDADLLRHAFAKVGIKNPMVEVEDGQKAVDYLNGNGVYADRTSFPMPGLILLDLKLPRLSGLEFLRLIRAPGPLRRIPVIVLTSSNQENDIRQAYDAGANSYLVKPTGADGLVAAVRALDAYWIKLNRSPML